MVLHVANILHLQLPLQQGFIPHLEFVADTLGEKFTKPLVDDPLLHQGVTVPVYDLVTKALTSAAHSVAYAGGAYANTGCFYGAVEHFCRGLR